MKVILTLIASINIVLSMNIKSKKPETINGLFGFSTRGPIYQTRIGGKNQISQLTTNNYGQQSNQMCSARQVKKENEEQTTCELLKTFEKYLTEKNYLVDLQHLVIARCLAFEKTKLKYYTLEPMSKINVYLPGQSPSTHFSTLSDQMSQLEAGDMKYIMLQIVIALKAMHENKQIHGDLEPENMFISLAHGKDIRVQLANPFLSSKCGDAPTALTVTPNRAYLPIEFMSNTLLNKNKPDYTCGVEDIYQLAVLMIDLGTRGMFNAQLNNKQGVAFRDVDLQTDRVGEELQLIAAAEDPIALIGKGLDDYAGKVENAMKESIKAKVGKAKAFLSDAFGSEDFKKIITGGLKPEQKERITMETILQMDWVKEAAKELRVSSDALAVAKK